LLLLLLVRLPTTLESVSVIPTAAVPPQQSQPYHQGPPSLSPPVTSPGYNQTSSTEVQKLVIWWCRLTPPAQNVPFKLFLAVAKLPVLSCTIASRLWRKRWPEFKLLNAIPTVNSTSMELQQSPYRQQNKDRQRNGRYQKLSEKVG
jgi:hypothetical protein